MTCRPTFPSQLNLSLPLIRPFPSSHYFGILICLDETLNPLPEKGFIKTEVSPPQGIPIRIVTALSRGISAAGDTRHFTFCRKTNVSKHFPAGMEVRA